MPYEIVRKMSMRLLGVLALAAAGLGPGTALAGVAIVLTPPMAVTSPPPVVVQPQFSYPPGMSPAPIAPLPPQVTYFTPPQAFPVIVTGHHVRRH